MSTIHVSHLIHSFHVHGTMGAAEGRRRAPCVRLAGLPHGVHSAPPEPVDGRGAASRSVWDAERLWHIACAGVSKPILLGANPRMERTRYQCRCRGIATFVMSGPSVVHCEFRTGRVSGPKKKQRRTAQCPCLLSLFYSLRGQFLPPPPPASPVVFACCP